MKTKGAEGRDEPETTPAPARPPAPHPHPRPRVPRRLLPASEWEHWDDQRLLDLRMCDLDLRIEGSALEERIHQLNSELEAAGLVFRPHFWLSNEWFSPDGVPGIAVPFYLAHPRLARLEMSQMREVEGGTPEWCMRILRHEAGHALDNAYRLRRRRQRQRLFGLTSVPYPDFYAPKPYSKSFVIHLETWYAQSHPDEDFAETFAVCFTPGSDWRERYAGWPALRKLEYMDGLIKELAGRPPLVTTRQRVEPLSSLRRTLRTHYRQRRAHYRVGGDPDRYDAELRRLFADGPTLVGRPPAATFLSRFRKEIRRLVRLWTGERQYIVDEILADMIERCRHLELRVPLPEEQAKLEFAVFLTVHVMNQLHTQRHRVPL